MSFLERPRRAIGMIPRPVMAFAALVPVAALLVTQYPTAFNTPFQRFMSTANVAEHSVTQWERIRIRTRQDLDMALPALVDIIKYPEAALSIKELTFDPMRLGSYNAYPNSQSSNPIVIPETLSEDETRLMDAVDAIGLDHMLGEDVKDALIWKTRESGTQTAANEGYRSKQALKRQFHEAKFANAVAILFCSLSPNLAILRTTEPPRMFAEFLTMINYRWASQESGKSILANLDQVHLITSRWPNTLNDERFYRWSSPIDFIRKFHRLPSLNTFSASVLDDQKGEIDHTPPGLSALKSISVTHSSLSSQVMGSLIRLPASLEKITLTTGGRSTTDDGTSLVYPKTLGKCLRQHKSTLRSIDLDLDYQLWFAGTEDMEQEDFANNRMNKMEEQVYQETLKDLCEDWRWAADKKDSEAKGYIQLSRDLPETKPYRATIGGFADFEKLETLKIGIIMLLGSSGDNSETPADLLDMLPPNLKHLTIRGYKKGASAGFDRHIESLLKEMKTKLPLLESVEGIDELIESGEPGYDCEDLGDCETEDVPPLYEEPRVNDGWLEAEREN